MPLNTITLEQAQQWAENWNKHKLAFFAKRDLKAFAIPRQVIEDVSSDPEVVHVRTYFGLDDELNPHLIVVGTNADGNDLIDEARGQHIYNFAISCPTYCPQVGPFINP